MIDDDIQNSVRLIKLYKHLPQRNLEELKLLITFENLSGFVLPTPKDIGIFENNLEEVHQLSDEKIFFILNSEEYHSASMKNVLLRLVKQMHVYLALRKTVIDENIHWLI